MNVVTVMKLNSIHLISLYTKDRTLNQILQKNRNGAKIVVAQVPRVTLRRSSVEYSAQYQVVMQLCEELIKFNTKHDQNRGLISTVCIWFQY